MVRTPRKSPVQLDREIADALSRVPRRHHSAISDDDKIRAAIARFPSTFGLRGFPGDVFRLSPTSSYVSGGRVLLYTQRKDGDRWLDFSKGTESELRGEIVPIGSGGRSHATAKKTAKKTNEWKARQMTSGRRVVEKTRGNKIARIFQGEGHWTVTINRADPRGPFETTGELTRQSAKTLAAAKALGTRLLKA